MNICPNCDSDLRGEPIDARHFVHNTPENNTPGKPFYNSQELSCDDQKARYGGRCYCLPYGEKELEDRFYSRRIGIEVRGVYDGVLFWQCPDCGHAWHRWEAPEMRAKAQHHINRQNGSLT